MRHVKTSMKSLLDRFMKAPYGFIEDDVDWLVAKLFKDGEISMFVNNEAVTLLSKSEEEVFRYLTRKEYNEKLLTEKRVKANDKQKKSVREVMKELFNVTPSSDDDDAIMKSFMGYIGDLKTDLEKLEIRYQNQHAYPGKSIVLKGKALIIEAMQLKYSSEFFAGIDAKRDDYLTFAEEYDPIEKFFSGDQIDIFDRAIRLMKIYDESKTFIVDTVIESVVGEIKEILKSRTPYRQIFKLPELLDKFLELYGKLLITMRKPVTTAIEEAKKRVFDELKGKRSNEILSDKFYDRFKEISDKAEHCNNVATLQNIKVEADALKVRLLNEIASEEAKLETSIVMPPAGDSEAQPQQPAPKPRMKKQKTISIKSVTVESTWQLETPEDVKRYVAALESKLINTLEEDTVINIEF